MLKPQDILVLLKIVVSDRDAWSYPHLAAELNMSSSEVHAAVGRVEAAGLGTKGLFGLQPIHQALEEFLVHGLRYVFYPKRGGLVRGIPTGYAALPLRKHFMESKEPPPVWPHPEGEVRGLEFSPLYKSAPNAARKDQKLYEWLALIDAVRGGRARERDLAIKELRSRLESLVSK
jgi:hypothetical protein